MAINKYILGIHDGHNCGATLICDGIVIASINEERLSRRKNEVGYPEKSIEEVLKIAGIEPGRIDYIVYASLFMHDKVYLENLDPWYHVGLDDQRKDQSKPTKYHAILFDQQKQKRIDVVRDHLRVDKEVEFFEHHLCHVAAAYYTSPAFLQNKRLLGVTCDGAGDNVSASVSICENGKITRVAETDRHSSLGKLYSRVTLLMGMKPWEHEFKLMGLAPYADKERVKAVACKLFKILGVKKNSMGFYKKTEMSMNYSYEYLREIFQDIRFDVIAGAIQYFTEELLLQWIQDSVEQTGIKDLVCGGGVFMNVKANMKVAQLDSVNSMYIMPSSGDESLSIGVCLYKYYSELSNLAPKEAVLPNLYLGDNYSDSEERGAIEIAANQYGYTVTESSDTDMLAAELLSDGAILARCKGRMEWGARSLGNRSILARSDDFRLVDQINKAIKMRDFWMPFAPSILDSDKIRYLGDNHNIESPYMTFAYEVLDESSGDLEAATHPRDKTVRPQIVTENMNKDYFRLLKTYKSCNGMGGILNTSFNLHGSPIVYKPVEAIDVLKKSGLDGLILQNFIVRK